MKKIYLAFFLIFMVNYKNPKNSICKNDFYNFFYYNSVVNCELYFDYNNDDYFDLNNKYHIDFLDKSKLFFLVKN